MKKHLNILISAVVFAISIFAFIYFVISRDTEDLRLVDEAKLLENKRISNLSLMQLDTGKDITDELLEGEIFVIYMLSTCEACKKETETLSKIQTKTNKKIFGVMFEDKEVVKNYINDHDIKFPVLIDNDKRMFETLDLRYFPTNLNLKDGIVKKGLFGSPESEIKLLEFINE